MRVCRSQTPAETAGEMRVSTIAEMEFLVTTMPTDDGPRIGLDGALIDACTLELA